MIIIERYFSGKEWSLVSRHVGVVWRTLDVDCFLNTATLCTLRVNHILEIAQVVWMIHWRARLRAKRRDVALVYCFALPLLPNIGLFDSSPHQLRRQLPLSHLSSELRALALNWTLTINNLSTSLTRWRICNVSLVNISMNSFIVHKPLWRPLLSLSRNTSSYLRRQISSHFLRRVVFFTCLIMILTRRWLKLLNLRRGPGERLFCIPGVGRQLSPWRRHWRHISLIDGLRRQSLMALLDKSSWRGYVRRHLVRFHDRSIRERNLLLLLLDRHNMIMYLLTNPLLLLCSITNLLFLDRDDLIVHLLPISLLDSIPWRVNFHLRYMFNFHRVEVSNFFNFLVDLRRSIFNNKILFTFNFFFKLPQPLPELFIIDSPLGLETAEVAYQTSEDLGVDCVALPFF